MKKATLALSAAILFAGTSIVFGQCSETNVKPDDGKGKGMCHRMGKGGPGGKCKSEGECNKGGQGCHRKGPRGQGKGCGQGGKGQGCMMKGLNLTDEQQAKLASMREANSAKMKATVEKMKQARMKMHAATRGDNIDVDAVTAAAKELKVVAAEFATAREACRSQFQSVLTDEQKVAFEKNKKEMEAKRAEMQKKRSEAKGGE